MVTHKNARNSQSKLYRRSVPSKRLFIINLHLREGYKCVCVLEKWCVQCTCLKPVCVSKRFHTYAWCVSVWSLKRKTCCYRITKGNCAQPLVLYTYTLLLLTFSFSLYLCATILQRSTIVEDCTVGLNYRLHKNHKISLGEIKTLWMSWRQYIYHRI